MSENRVLRRIFGPKKEEVVGGWRKMHKEGPCNLYFLLNVRVVTSGRMRWGACTMHRRVRKVYKILIEKPEARRPLGRLKCRWEYNIKMDL